MVTGLPAKASRRTCVMNTRGSLACDAKHRRTDTQTDCGGTQRARYRDGTRGTMVRAVGRERAGACLGGADVCRGPNSARDQTLRDRRLGHRTHALRQAVSHSITSFARPNSVIGKARPSDFAVLRLMTNSVFVGTAGRRVSHL